MKKTLFLFILSILGCTSDDTSTVSETDLKLVKETIVYANTTVTRNFIYENNLLSKITGNVIDSDQDDETFTYSSGKLMKIKLYLRQNFDDPARPVTLIMSYDGENIQSYTSTFNDSSEPSKTITNTYVNGRLDYQTLDNGNQGFRHEYYENGNLHKIKSGNSDIFIYNSYDNKKNPYYLVYTDPYLRMQIYSPNNALNVSGNSLETYEYEYNSYDYPTKVIKRVNGTIFSTTTYVYNLD